MMEIMSSEEFIDMEMSLTPSSSSSSPSTQYRGGNFEFPLITSSSSHNNYFNSQLLDHQINSADELFYQGKLLPLLHLKNFNNDYHHIIPTTSTSPNTPPDSCRVSCDDNRENESFVEWSNEVKGFTHHTHPPKKRPNNWPKRLLYKLKSSRAYLFFAKSATCSNLMEASNKEKLLSFEKKAGCNNNNNNKRNIPLKDLLFESHRKSFSGAISASLSSSSSSSSTPSLVLNSIGAGRSNDHFQVLKRSRSADPELESFIQGAIAHCKLSHK